MKRMLLLLSCLCFIPLPSRAESSDAGIFITLTRTAYSQNDLPTSAEEILPEKIKMLDAQNAGEAISRQTSIQTLPTGQLESFLTAHIRGSTANQTLVLVDGRPVTGASLGVPDLSEIPTENIDRIEILRGGASALYGPNAMGGVINVITKRASGAPHADASLEVGSFGRQAYRANAGSRMGPVDVSFFGDLQDESGFRDNSDARARTVGGNAGISLGEGGKLLLDIASYHKNAGIPGFDHDTPLMPNQFNNVDEKASTIPTARSVTGSDYLRTAYLLALPADSNLALRFFGTRREAETTIPEFNSHQDTHTQSQGGEAQLDLPWGLTVGGSFVHDREDSADVMTPANSFIQRVDNWGIFAQDRFSWNVLTLIPSGRYDHNSQFGDTSNPRVQVIVDAAPWLRFSGSAARSFRAPTIDEVTPIPGGFSPYLGGPNLRPETAWTYDGGFEIHDASSSLKATYFRANIKDLIQTVSTDPSNLFAPFEAINVGEARREGFEISMDQAFNRHVRNELNYTYLQNRGVLPGSADFVLLQYSPRHTVNDILSFVFPKGWTVDLTGRYLDSRWSANNKTGTKLGSQYVQDVRVAYPLRPLEFYLGVSDLFDTRYEEQPGFPLPGRTFFGGVTMKFLGTKS